MGDQSGALQLFMTCSSKPWFETTQVKGTITAIKIGSLMNNPAENRLVVITLEGNFYMFNIFELLSDYERDMKSDMQNERQQAIEDTARVEEEDAEQLINEIDLDFEANFDTNLLLGRRKQSSS